MIEPRPIPDAQYPCATECCAEEYSWPAEDLYWSDQHEGWYCDRCFAEELEETCPDESMADYLAKAKGESNE